MFFAAAPLAEVALAALGYLCGKIRLGSFVLGPVAATLYSSYPTWPSRRAGVGGSKNAGFRAFHLCAGVHDRASVCS